MSEPIRVAERHFGFRPHRPERAWIRAIALACIATGAAAISLNAVTALGAGSHHSPRTAGPVVRAATEPSSPNKAPITVAPTTSTSPPPATATAEAPPPNAAAVAPSGNSSPSSVNDPSEIATSIVPSLPLYASPGATTPEASLPIHNYLGATLVMLVASNEGSWIRVYVPERPNGATAWVPASDVTIGSVPCHIVVSLGARQLVLYCDNVSVFSAAIAPGAPDSPTPTGSFYVAYIVKLTDPGGPYGPYALGTSAFSNTYYSFEGGPGQVGIHGTDQPWVIGSYASHGCVRLNNNDITALASKVVPGTPVEIAP